MKKLTLITIILSILAITNAQIDKNEILDTDSVPKTAKLGLLKVFTTNAHAAQKENIDINSLPKHELPMTPEIIENLVTHNNNHPERRSQLMNFQFGKPIPEYVINIDNGSLIFSGRWRVLKMSNGEPVSITRVELEDDGQYRWVGTGAAPLAKLIHNYEYKDLIIGCIRVSYSGMDFLIISKDNEHNFIKVFEEETREYFKEYSLGEIINFLKE